MNLKKYLSKDTQMATKQMKLLNIISHELDKQIKKSLLPIRMAKINNNKCWQGYGKFGTVNRDKTCSWESSKLREHEGPRFFKTAFIWAQHKTLP